MMELTRVKPFGKRRKTYFYAVAGLVLAAHVVIGSIIHVMPPELSEPSGGVAVEMQIVEHLLADDVVESSAVQMIEEELRDEDPVELPIFEPLWQPTPIDPDIEPLGPTETVLPEADYEESPAPPAPEPAISQPARVTTPPVKKIAPTPAPKKTVRKSPPVKKKAPPPPPKKKVTSPVKKKVTPPPPSPQPKRAAPVEKPRGKTGLLNRRSPRSAPEKYVQASWRKRPPPFYPYEQRKRGIEGTAHVRVSISSSGRITSARLVKSTGNKQLDQAALLSVKKGTMNPARRGSRSVSSEMIVPFEFYR